MTEWDVPGLSVGFMGPVMAMSLNGIGVAGLVGKAVPFTFVVSFAGTMLVAYAFIRLNRYFTHAGSVYGLAGATLGPRAGFCGGFASLGTDLFFAACIAGACSVFFAAMLTELGVTSPSWVWIVVPLVVAGFVTLLNVREFGFLPWAGFESGTSPGEQTRDPTRTIPHALTYAVVTAGVLYTLVLFAETIGYGTDAARRAAFAGASSTLTELSSRFIGAWSAVLISVIAFLVAFASLLSSTAAAARLVFALARDGFSPAALARTSRTTGVTFRPGSPIARWEAVLPALGLGYLAYVYLVQVAGQEPPYTYFPWMAGAWCLLGAIVIFAAPRLAERIGARLTTEDLR